MQTIHLTLPLDKATIATLRAGDTVYLTGELYTARDAAHKRMVQCIANGQALPIDVKNQLIYYAGPAPTPPGRASGSVGPTTSYRMDAYTPQLLDAGLLGMMGKGKRSPAVIEAMQKTGAVYFGAVGGAAALIAQCVTKSEVVAYPDLGAEAIHRFTVKDFPAIVLIDSLGANLYELGPQQYRIDPC